MTTMYSSWDMVRDGPKDGQKWHIEVGAPPKKSVELQCKSIDWFLQNIRLNQENVFPGGSYMFKITTETLD